LALPGESVHDEEIADVSGLYRFQRRRENPKPELIRAPALDKLLWRRTPFPGFAQGTPQEKGALLGELRDHVPLLSPNE
jgi:hypothetical protein